jgi:DNA polymerase III delta prime subunit
MLNNRNQCSPCRAGFVGQGRLPSLLLWGPPGSGKTTSLPAAATVFFVDKIHRFSKSQQDAFLPHVESGLLTLIGVTTEKPSFEVIAPLSDAAAQAFLGRKAAKKKKGGGQPKFLQPPDGRLQHAARHSCPAFAICCSYLCCTNRNCTHFGPQGVLR